MRKIVYSLSIASVLIFATSCDKDFLDVQPKDKFAESAVWEDPALIEAVVNNVYFGIPHGFSNMMLSSLTDESMYNADFGSSNVTKSLVTPSDYSVWDRNFWTANRYRQMTWDYVYRNIRATNIFFEKIDEAPFEDEEWRDRLKGEMHFLRAHLYHNLVSVYGGVPLITEAYGLDDDFMVARNTYEESINFIAEECDKAAALLPLVHDTENLGRATKGAALALKARALLFAASDLYNSNASWAGGYAHPELVGYVGGDQMARWQAAKDAAKAVMDLGVYSLYMPDAASPEQATQNYAKLFLEKQTSEDIFVRFFLQKTDESWDGYNPGLYNNPNGYHGWGSNTPIGQMVDSYEMIDGSKFDWANPAHAASPYENRDPRFYASINYEGAEWRQRPADVVSLDPAGKIQTGFFNIMEGGTVAQTVPGLDTRKGPIEDWNGTYTGYYLRKFIDPTVDAQYVKQEAPWRFFRYTEVLLNYAEASLELGQEAEAREIINMIRRRAGMPETNESGQALMDRYRNERRVELAFEDHRFFDVRRWMIAPQSLEDAQGVNITYQASTSQIPAGADTYHELREGTAVPPNFEVISIQERDWKDRAYFLPIKLDEMNRNNQLIQNPLY
jgi:hypothetical protein